MPDPAVFWAGLPATTQDLLIALALLAPGLCVGAIVLRGHAPWTLVGAMLRRFASVNLVFVALIAVAVAVGVGLTAQERALRSGTARAAEKFDLVFGAPGSETTLMLAAVYLQPADMPLLSGTDYAEIAADPKVAMAAPIAFGDSAAGMPVVGTTAEFVAHLSGGLAEGRLFRTASEAVAGALAEVAIGDEIEPAHGHGPGAEEDAHEGAHYTVTGRMPASGTPWDRAILVPIEGVWAVHGLADGHGPEDAGRIGPPFDPDRFPGTPAIIVRATDLWANYTLRSRLAGPDRMAIFPGTVLAQFHALMGDVREAMSLLALVAQVLVTVAVICGLVILARLFSRNLALLRALGAPDRFVFAVVWSWNACLVVVGSLAGLAFGQLAAWLISEAITERTDLRMEASLGWSELHLVAGSASLTMILALVPAALAIRRPILMDLRG